jgi:hypothetical protein
MDAGHIERQHAELSASAEQGADVLSGAFTYGVVRLR